MTMPIKIMKRDSEELNTAIQTTCDMIYDIEDLLDRGPKQLESFCALLRIFKDLKRGKTLPQSLNANAIQCCPPGIGPTEHCETITCQACWEEYVKTYLNKIKEKQ